MAKAVYFMTAVFNGHLVSMETHNLLEWLCGETKASHFTPPPPCTNWILNPEQLTQHIYRPTRPTPYWQMWQYSLKTNIHSITLQCHSVNITPSGNILLMLPQKWNKNYCPRKHVESWPIELYGHNDYIYSIPGKWLNCHLSLVPCPHLLTRRMVWHTKLGWCTLRSCQEMSIIK